MLTNKQTTRKNDYYTATLHACIRIDSKIKNLGNLVDLVELIWRGLTQLIRLFMLPEALCLCNICFNLHLQIVRKEKRLLVFSVLFLSMESLKNTNSIIVNVQCETLQYTLPLC